MNNIFLANLHKELLRITRPVILVAVTKSVGINETNDIIQEGVHAIGENRVEDFERKAPHLLPVERHFIGQIQSRKIKRIVELFDVIQSVGSLERLEKIEREAVLQNKPIKILLQFNISKETQKSGFDGTHVQQIIETLPKIQHVKIIGVMGMAADTPDTELVRKQFRSLKRIRDELQTKFPEIKGLSMGMSDDYKIALEEGATMLRIGRALFNH